MLPPSSNILRVCSGQETRTRGGKAAARWNTDMLPAEERTNPTKPWNVSRVMIKAKLTWAKTGVHGYSSRRRRRQYKLLSILKFWLAEEEVPFVDRKENLPTQYLMARGNIDLGAGVGSGEKCWKATPRSSECVKVSAEPPLFERSKTPLGRIFYDEFGAGRKYVSAVLSWG